MYCKRKTEIRILSILMVLLVTLSAGCQSEVLSPPIAEPNPSPVSTPSPVASAEATPDSIVVLSDFIETDFPRSLSFNLAVMSGTDITSIELRYKIVKMTSATITTTIKPEFTSGHQVQTSWIWDTRKASLPPAAEIEYRWIIRNQAGDHLRTVPTTIRFDDSRYQWQEATSDKIHLFWYEGGQRFAQELLDAAQAASEKLKRDIGATLEHHTRIYIYANSEDLQRALVFPQEWTGGVAFGGYGIIAIGIAPNSLNWGKRIIAHELAHLVIHQMTFNPYADLPTWLDEGMAMYAEGDLREELASMLREGIAQDDLFSVRSLGSGFPAKTSEAGLAYAESYSLVRFLLDNYGREKMLGLLNIFKQGSSPDDALTEIYGFDTEGLDDAWRESLGIEPHVSGRLKSADPDNPVSVGSRSFA